LYLPQHLFCYNCVCDEEAMRGCITCLLLGGDWLGDVRGGSESEYGGGDPY